MDNSFEERNSRDSFTNVSNLTNCKALEDNLPNFCDSHQEMNSTLTDENSERNVELLKLVDIKNCNHTPSCKNAIVCLKGPLKLINGGQRLEAQYELPEEAKKYKKKTVVELKSLSVKEVRVIIEALSQAVESVSSELVSLLLENDTLQGESDARNIAIEQLLKLTVKNNEAEL